jgi:protein TonB
MKKTLFTLIPLLFILSVRAQQGKSLKISVNEDTVVCVSVDQFPKFPGGLQNFNSFVARTMQFPTGAQDQNIHGRVFISMIVERNGTLSDLKVVKSLSVDFDKEAIRIMSLCPKWNPGIQNGHAVRVYWDVKIIFQKTKN